MSNTVIAISRQYGSGDRQIGQHLSEVLGIPFYDKEIIRQAALNSGIDECHFSGADQRGAGSPLYSANPGVPFELPLSDKLYLAQHTALRQLAVNGACVIVGRGACGILKGIVPLLSVFLYADLPVRKKRIVEEYGEPSDNLEKKIRDTDKKRMAYYTFYEPAKQLWTEHFDLCIDSGRFGIAGTVSLILGAYGSVGA